MTPLPLQRRLLVAHQGQGVVLWRDSHEGGASLAHLTAPSPGAAPGSSPLVAVLIDRLVFEGWLSQGVPERFDETLFESKRSWELAVRYGHLRWRWDGPDALVLTLRGAPRSTLLAAPLAALPVAGREPYDVAAPIAQNLGITHG